MKLNSSIGCYYVVTAYQYGLSLCSSNSLYSTACDDTYPVDYALTGVLYRALKLLFTSKSPQRGDIGFQCAHNVDSLALNRC